MWISRILIFLKNIYKTRSQWASSWMLFSSQVFKINSYCFHQQNLEIKDSFNKIKKPWCFHSAILLTKWQAIPGSPHLNECWSWSFNQVNLASLLWVVNWTLGTVEVLGKVLQAGEWSLMQGKVGYMKAGFVSLSRDCLLLPWVPFDWILITQCFYAKRFSLFL